MTERPIGGVERCADCGVRLDQDNAGEASTSCDYCEATLRGAPWPGTASGAEDEQDRYADKSDRQANVERQADVAAARARSSSGPRTSPAPPPATTSYVLPRIPRTSE